MYSLWYNKELSKYEWIPIEELQKKNNQNFNGLITKEEFRQMYPDIESDENSINTIIIRETCKLDEIELPTEYKELKIQFVNQNGHPITLIQRSKQKKDQGIINASIPRT